MKKKIGLSIAFLVLISGAFLWYVFRDEPVLPPAIVEQVPDKTMSYSGNELKEEKDGKTIWTVKAEKMNVDGNTGVIKMEIVTAKLYEDNGKVTELVADNAVYHQKKGKLALKGEIQAQSTDGSSLAADTAHYDTKEQILQCDGNVRVNKDGYLISGAHLETDRGMKTVRVSGNAEVIKVGGNAK